jgi:NAD-dependent SIR2 family protein deacetylase
MGQDDANERPVVDAAELDAAAGLLAAADALIVTAGAGMGVDSGLPDFRGNEGFWRAYPPFRALGLSFASLANPRWFREDPELAWGFYGHRLHLYRRTTPHEGFGILRRWGARAPLGAFVFTSNVDGQFQRAGFDPSRIVECHGAIDWLQCLERCGAAIFRADGVAVDVDPQTFRARAPLPRCNRCGGLARPAILMFGDADWESSHFDAQEARLSAFLDVLRRRGSSRVVVVECGAGSAVPTVRRFGEAMTRVLGATLVRINMREPEVPDGHVGLAMGALPALRAIDARIGSTDGARGPSPR